MMMTNAKIAVLGTVAIGGAMLVRNVIMNKKTPEGFKSVPVVSKKLPYVGHGLSFSKDIIGFIQQCYKEHGPIFRLKVFRRDMIVICDRQLLKEFFAKQEGEMSMYKVLKDLYFGDAFSDDPKNLNDIIKIVKGSITMRTEEFMPKILEEGHKMIERLEKSTGKPININDEAIRFVANTSARCFVGIELDDEMFKELMYFTHLLNRLVVMTYFVPKSAIRLFFNGKLSSCRRRITKLLVPEIRKYLKDANYKESKILRTAVDFYKEKSPKESELLENVGNIIICLLYVSSENTALGLSNAVSDIITNPKYWTSIREECAPSLACKDYKTLFANETLDNCVMESARLNAHAFPLNRQPISQHFLGEYYVKGADVLGICSPMLMNRECAEDIFKDPNVYNPQRFGQKIHGETGKKQSKTQYDVLTWGAGTHQCPGKLFAILEIKTGIALIANYFKHPKVLHLGKLDYFSPSAFAERKVIIELEKFGERPYFQTLIQDESRFEVYIGDRVISGRKIIVEGGVGFLLRDCLDQDEQMNLYAYTVNQTKGTQEQEDLKTHTKRTAAPLMNYNNIYTQKSNCSEPTLWITKANDIWRAMRNIPGFFDDEFTANSVVAQLFGQNGSMIEHKDEYVDYGISVSIGAACEFRFGGETMNLTSGDVLIADFSSISHEVVKINENSTPAWFDEEQNPDIITFGKSRCSIQIRDISRCWNNSPKLSHQDFAKILG